MLRAATSFVLLLACCILVAVPLGCSKSDPADAVSNIPPEPNLRRGAMIGSRPPTTVPRPGAPHGRRE